MQRTRFTVSLCLYLTHVCLCVGLTTSVTYAADSKIKLGLDNLNGPTEFLRQSLRQSPEEARLLAAAQRQLIVGDSDLAFQALQAVFAHEHDSFTPIYRDKPASSTYRAAFRLLQSADFKTRKQWTQTSEIPAAIALKSANTSGASEDVASVARQFPFTESGLQAMALSAMTAHSLGQTSFAEAILSEAERTYEQTTLSFNATPLLNDLRKRIRKGVSVPASFGEFAGGVIHQPPSQLNLPWPKPLWRWEESLWSNGAMATVLGGVTLPENRSLLPMSSWRPAFTESTIILRTPARIVCFDKLTGHIQWQLRTDTVESRPSMKLDINELPLQSTTPLADLLQMDDLGSVTASDGAVFFVDHFRKFQSGTEAAANVNIRQQQRNIAQQIEMLNTSPDSSGRRLVCVQLTPGPHIAWTIGDAPVFEYQPTDKHEAAISQDADSTSNPVDSTPQHSETQRPAAEDARPNHEDSPFAQHRFLGPPLAHDQLLYVLSADPEVAWINCLTQSTGRLLWREPIAYHSASNPELSSRYIVFSQEPVGASLCGVDGNVIISALNNGVVVGSGMTDGKLLWATNFREPDRNPGSRLGRAYFAQTLESSRRGFQPLLAAGRMVWSAPQSGLVHSVDTQTGKIQWTARGEADGTGSLEGSTDSYAVAADSDRVVMIGARHIRALSMADGTQQWIAEIQRQGGRAFCNGRTCLIPQLDGSLAMFDAQTGIRKGLSSQFAFTQDAVFSGSLYSDRQVLCAATPISVTLLPTHALMRSRLQKDGSNVVSAEQQLLQARLHLMAGETDAGVSALKKLLETTQRKDPQSHPLQRTCRQLLADTILNGLARQRLEAADSSEAPIDLTALDNIDLNLHQQLKYQLLVPERQVLPTDLTLNTPPTVKLTPDWSVRADVAAYATLSNERAQQIAPTADATSQTFADIERAILFPWQIGTAEQQLFYAQQLIGQSLYAAAELFLVSARQSALAPDRPALQEQQNQLRKLQQHTPPVPHRVVLKHAEFEMNEQVALVAESSIPQILAATNAIVEIPEWYPERLFIVGRSFHSINMTTGAVSVPRKLPASVDAAEVVLREDVPGLVPLTGNEHLGMLSLVNPAHPELLWWRRIQKDVADPSPIDVGPVGPGFVIAATGSMVQCLHPLTGALLWKQKLTASRPSHGRFRRTVRIVGDHQVVGILGERSESCTLFRTLDGKRLPPTVLQIPQGQTPLASGRMLLYQNRQQLALVDLLTGKNVMEVKPPVKVLKNGQGRLLSNHRAAVLTADGSLTVLDMATGDIAMTSNLGEDFKQTQLVGMTVIERDNRLYLLAKDFGNTQRHLSATPGGIGDPRLDSGTLYCIDSQSGDLMWQRTSVPSVMPQIHGDPINLLLMWSWQNPGYDTYTERRLGAQQQQNAQRSLLLTLVDSDTGETVAEGKHFSPTKPLRCVHNASQQRIEVHTEKSLIIIDYLNPER